VASGQNRLTLGGDLDVKVWRVVDGKRRDRLAHEVLNGWVSGPDAPIEATAEI
jgi:hypothetical protein